MAEDSTKERPAGGFRFDNVARNDLLERMGVESPIATKTGTTIVGLIYKVSCLVWGDDIVKNKSFVQAHGSSTPQNRVTESQIFDRVAEAFGITSWPVSAVKSYVGHSLGPASGDQLATSLGVFDRGILPGIKTIDKVAEDVHDGRLSISTEDQNLGKDRAQVAFLNSKGFGGNNATATVFSPDLVRAFLEKNYSSDQLAIYDEKRTSTEASIDRYLTEVDAGEFNPIYEFGNNMVDDEKIVLSSSSLQIPGYSNEINLDIDEGLSGF